MENYQDLNGNNSTDNPLHTNSTFLLEPTLESELKKLLENKNKSRDLKFDKISFLSKNIQSIGNGIPFAFCNITRLYLSNNNIISLEGIEQFANLTHLSISYNLIEDIYELNHIINPEILLHLNVKGNFFCKNPSYEEVILNLFINLKTLDDLKINNSHKKIIKSGQNLSKIIMIFLLDIEEKIKKISMIKNVYNLNNEYNLINSSNNDLQQLNKDNLNSLIEEFNNIDESPICQILSLINEKRFLNNSNYYFPINDINNLLMLYLNNTTNNLIISENNKIKEIYFNLFTTLILNQKRKDYRGFLNYLIMTSEPKLFEYIKSKGDNLKYIENDKASINIICQNFEKILLKYSDYTLENINEIQMMIFYLYFNGNNIVSDNENDVQIIIDKQNGIEKIILNNYEQKVITFREMIPEYFPMFVLDEEFMKSFMNYLKDKLNIFLMFINEMKQIKQNNKLNQQKEEKNNNINLENIEKKNVINNNVEEIVNINNNEIEDNNNKNIDNQKIPNLNDNNEYIFNNQEINNILQKDNEDNNLNKPFIYNSRTDFYKNDNIINNNKNEKNIRLIQENNNINDFNQNFNIQNNINEENNKTNIENIKNELIKNIKPNQEIIQKKYNIIQAYKILNNIISNNHILPKKLEFFNSLKQIQDSSKFIQINDSIDNLLLKHKIRNSFKTIKNIKKSKNDKSRSKSKKKNIIKEESEHVDNNELDKKALKFYYYNLKKNLYMVLKFNYFCKKEYLNRDNKIKLEEKMNKYNDNINSDIYNFFHGKEEKENIIAKLKNNIEIVDKNNSVKLININNINKESLENEVENKNKIDYIKDKNYNEALKLRKNLEMNNDIIEEENTEVQNMLNSQQSKNEVDELLNSLKTLYKEIDEKTIKTNKSTKSNEKNEYDKKNKEYINKLREVREKEKEKAKRKFGKVKYDQNKLLGCPNFIKNTYSSVLKNIY